MSKIDVKIKKKKCEKWFQTPLEVTHKGIIGKSLILDHNKGPFSQSFNKFEGQLYYQMYLDLGTNGQKTARQMEN